VVSFGFVVYGDYVVAVDRDGVSFRHTLTGAASRLTVSPDVPPGRPSQAGDRSLQHVK
jgi:hypothetical protein